ncbi:hypothetical protein PR202_gb23993 [Eleusine coracana subsp. coracana]|uniref:Uncharacterized protein n=1 Tax=Eleusine coracana subsp. coracana TaxID=191504 RepID=A0AAV5FKI2_ELECO|nr:hypothetical protein QOZ80_5BG0442860 [Eleusine coracana subsp. coracana]GJN35243.1 hypothetical protein PR202_gb23993 [Eleusine coracana subsp. coracana]
MALTKVSVALLLAVFLAAAAAPASAASAACRRKITVQNLSGRDLMLTLEPLANSPHLWGGAGYMLHHGSHAEFSICLGWTGRLHAPEAPTAEFHVGHDGGAWYMAPVGQSGPVHVTVTPHTDRAFGGLQGHCPAVGCANNGQCFAHAVPGGNCANVDELKIIYYSP